MNRDFRRGMAIGLTALVALSMGLCDTIDARSYPLEYRSPADRATAVYWLGERQILAAVPLLIELCDDPDGGVRSEAVRALGKLKDPRAVEVLERIAADPKQESCDGVVVPAQGIIHMGPVPKTMSHNIRHEAERALLAIPGPQGPREAEPAIERLRAMNREAVRRYAQRRDPDTARTYYDTDQGRADSRAYFEAYETIQIINAAPGSKGTAALLGVLGCGNENLEWLAAAALAARKPDDVFPPIHELLTSPDPSNLTLTICLKVLLAHDKPAAHDVALRLIERLKTADDFDRFPHREQYYLAQALQPKDVVHLQSLRKARTDPAEREQLDLLIRRVRGEELPRDLWDYDEIPPAQREAVLPALREALKSLDPEDWKKLKAAYLVGRNRYQELVPELIELIAAGDSPGYGTYRGKANTYPMMAAWALCEIDARDSVDQLRAIVLDTTLPREGRMAAALACGKLAGPSAVADLQALFAEQDPECDTRASLLSTRMKLRFLWIDDSFLAPRAERESATIFAGSFAYSLRCAAALALAQVGGDDARRTLVDYLKSGQPVTKPIAVAALSLDRTAPDEWSRQQCGKPTISTLAIDLRLDHYPQTSEPFVLALLDRRDVHSDYLIARLQYVPLHNERITIRLIESLAESPVEKICNRRVRIINALACQQGNLATVALLEYARNGKLNRAAKVLEVSRD